MNRPAKRAKLLSDVSSSDESEVEEGKPAINGLKVNEEFAKRFEHNKKREEMQRLEEKYTKPSKNFNGNVGGGESGDEEEEDSEDDESEDDEGDLATRDVDDEIFATLQAIKQKDPRVYDQSVQFYLDFDANAEEADEGAQQERPMYLQDYHRQNLLAGHTGEGEDDVEPVPRTYQQEQDAMKRDLVGSMHATANGTTKTEDDESEEDELLVTKSKPKHDGIPKALVQRITDSDVAAADKDPETYLSNFLAARAWVPNDSTRWQAFDSDDSEEEKRAEEFEEAYNLRFEDPATANEKLQSFARSVGKYSVRRDEKSGRQRARDREREQKEAARRERDEERARLRKLKIEEAEEKVKRIRDAAGLRGEVVDVDVWRDIIDGDFEDEKWEEEMKRRFGEEYYAEGEDKEGSDVDMEEGDKRRKVKKPKWDDDIDIDDLVPDFEKADDKPAFTLSSDDEGEDERIESTAPLEIPHDPDESNQASPTKKSTAKRGRVKAKAEAKRNSRLQRRQIEDLVDASLPLSHPTLVAATTKAPVTGFRYRETSPLSFGLNARDILFADDAQLNEYAGLKKMAAFRDSEKKRRDKKKYSKKARLREWRRETFRKREGIEENLTLDSSMGQDVEMRKASGEVGNVVDGERKKKRKRKGKKGE